MTAKTPDRDITNNIIDSLRNKPEKFDANLNMPAMFKLIANQLEAERDFADQLNDELGKANGQMVKLCTGLDDLNAEIDELYDIPSVVTRIGSLLEDANWTDK